MRQCGQRIKKGSKMKQKVNYKSTVFNLIRSSRRSNAKDHYRYVLIKIEPASIYNHLPVFINLKDKCQNNVIV